jgi:hypothetical protein
LNTSPFFQNLRAAYQSELDDLRTDTEGQDVLHERLTAKRRELGFLVKVMADDPEMVAVVLHRAFRFANPDRMDQLLARDADEMPTWDRISDTIEIASWAEEIVQTILKEPVGAWFMTVSASLEYMFHKPLTAQERAVVERQLGDDEEGKQDRDALRDERHEDSHTEDHDEEESSARAREEAGNDWMVEQGFDRKD